MIHALHYSIPGALPPGCFLILFQRMVYYQIIKLQSNSSIQTNAPK